MSARGFTLIEMLVSIAIGGAICATAFVAVRVASQSVTSGNRLSVENQVLRAGVSAALDDLDLWTSYDDPAPGGDQPLRGDGHPFSPMAPMQEDYNFSYNPCRVRPDGSLVDYETWWRRDSRAWFRGDPNVGVWGRGAFGLGDYSLFGTIDYGDANLLAGAEKRWHHRMIKELSEHQGYLAMIDYAPASTLFQWSMSNGVTHNDFVNGGSGGIGTCISNAWWEDKAHDFVCLLTGTFFTIVVPSRATDPLYQDARINHAMFQSWWNYGAQELSGPNPGWSGNDGYDACGTRLVMLPLRPTAWPDVSVRVRHYAANARQFHSATVISRSAISGQLFKLYFTFTGTTLRGARRMRNLDPQWNDP